MNFVKSKLVYLIFLLSLCFSVPVSAQVPDSVDFSSELSVHRLPEGRRCVVEGVIYQCFNLEEYKTLLKMDTDIQELSEKYKLAVETINVLYEFNGNLELIVEEQDKQISLLQEERTRLIEMWKKENKLRLEAENKPALGNWVAWGTAAAEAGVILGLLLALLL